MAAASLLEFLGTVKGKSRRDIALPSLYYFEVLGAGGPMTASQLKKAMTDARVPGAKTMNVADVMGKAGNLVAAQGKLGSASLWSLTDTGRETVEKLLGLEPANASKLKDEATLQSVVAALQDDVVRSFVDEALTCFRADALRASVVFLWSGAIRTLQDRAFAQGAAKLNPAIKKHDPKAKDVSKIEDFSSIKDVTTLLAVRELGLVDKGEWQTLLEGLDLRNRSGHPTKYRPGEKKVSAFIEDVIGIVFSSS